MSRALVYNAAFPVLGGGERYTVALGSVIAESHEVTYAAPNRPEPARLAALGFPPIEVEEVPVERFSELSADFDLAVLVASGAPPPSFARRSILVVQYPRDESSGRTGLATRANLRRYTRVVYSEFVRRAVRERWGVDATVLMPGVEVPEPSTRPKEPLILSVGRFVGHPHDNWTSKRQDALIDAFAGLPDDVRASWRLVLAGGCAPSPEMERYLAELREQAAGLAVSFAVNATPEELADLQDRARLFWHASGFERPADEPEQAEHFGMSTAEAMCHGAIPLVYADGGQLEIVTGSVGRLWTTLPELVDATRDLVATPPTELDALGEAARAAGRAFGRDRFDAEVRALLEEMGVHRRAGIGSGPRARRARWGTHRRASHLFHRVRDRVRDGVRRVAGR